MPADDPISAAEFLIASDERLRPPLGRFAGDFARVVKLLLPLNFELVSIGLDRIADRLDQRARENCEYLLSVVAAEVKLIGPRLREVAQNSETQRRFLEEELPGLVLDGLRRAEQIRARERITRLGCILSHAAEVGSQDDPDQIEELMRVATELTDRDIIALRELVRNYPRRMTGRLTSRLIRGRGIKAWDKIPWRELGFSEHDVESTCSKLASFGLVARLNRPPAMDNTTFTVGLNEYELLEKGRAFVEYIRSASATNVDTAQDVPGNPPG